MINTKTAKQGISVYQMNLKEHYSNLYYTSKEKIIKGLYKTDPLINTDNDTRFGITLVIRPDQQTKNAIQSFLSEIIPLEPHQYYYPNSDIHITLLSVISCYNGFSLDNITIEDYTSIIEEGLNGIRPFKISFKGITASDSCIIVQGFPDDNSLNLIRDQLRSQFKNVSIEQSIDKRYAIQTAHATVIRFRAPLTNTSKLITTLEKYRDHNFGTFTVNSIELVYNDWYQRKKFVKTLKTFNLD
ncbi:2'-5' RNA ligase family protein [Neptunitalea lumnitzerae]|uniref:A-kinase anchor protein 7-like phosphoesterase domain-containing protein n=1 Tax=Neptunitalea lumnitzerae TaxID=2965509 RepID=A0ABQ5MK37_9FLAO|nr:mutarotase [Neptunitalea sp. Y10]GLB49771.1 hypothetical protein Y10_21390 [Neptunitalea sp. Y10]